MGTETDNLAVEYVEATRDAEMRTRNIFLGSVLLSALVVFHLTFLAQPGGALTRIVRISFPPVLLWSLSMTGYAFYSLWQASQEKGQLLEKMAATDLSTGVKSREFIKAFLQKQYERAMETGKPTAVLYVDLENLDLVNKKFGHTIGDIVLKGIAKTVEHAVPSAGVVGRVAGDEFIVVLPATRSEKAKPVAESIEQSIRDYRLDLGKKGQLDFLGCRIGIVACPGDGGLAEELIGIAQKAAAESAPERVSDAQ